MYLEGRDQHRGWFHSSLLAAVGVQGGPPYKAVLTHGFVVDGDGRNMSKSQGNVIAPQEIIAKHGAEVLRLWVAAMDYRDDIRLSKEILTRLVEGYRRIRNTCRYLLGNLPDFDAERDSVPVAELLRVAFGRWHIEKWFERAKQEAGFGAFEMRTYDGLIRHWLCTSIGMYFLAEQTQRLRGEKSADHAGTSGRRGQHAGGESLGDLAAILGGHGQNSRVSAMA
jgi:isoleucyl-tRNA synthetase